MYNVQRKSESSSLRVSFPSPFLILKKDEDGQSIKALFFKLQRKWEVKIVMIVE